MIKINLLAERKAARGKTRGTGVQLAPSGGGFGQGLLLALVLALVVVFIGWQWFSLSSQRTKFIEDNRKADEELTRLEEVRKKGEDYKQQRTLLERKVNLITELKKNQAVPVHILDQISKNLPDFLWLDAMREQGNALTLRGKATNYNAVANFYNNLAASEWFANVTQGAVTESPEGVTFSLTCDFVKPNPPPGEAQAAKVGQG